MEPVALLTLLGNCSEIETNKTAGRGNSDDSAFSFLQIIEALLNLLDLPSKTDSKGEGDLLDLKNIGEKSQIGEKEQLSSAGQEVSLSLQNTGEPLLSMATAMHAKQNNLVMADALELLSMVAVEGTENVQSGEHALVTTPLLRTPMSVKGDLQDFLPGSIQGSMTDPMREGIPSFDTQEGGEQNQGFSVFADGVETAESKPVDAAVKAEGVKAISAQQVNLVADFQTADEKTAEAKQDKLFEQFSGVKKEEQQQPVSGRTQESPSLKNKTNQFGPLTTGNGSASTGAVLGDKRNDLSIAKDMLPEKTAELIARQIVDKAELFVGKERADLRLQLNPDFLGHLKLIIRVENGVVHAHFIAENQITASLIQGQMQDLRQCLEQQGISWQQISVAVGGQESFHGHHGYASYDSPQGNGYARNDPTPEEQGEHPWWQEGIVDYLV